MEGIETMQLGMIGLGRMGADMVRRLMRGGHTCVVYDRSPQAVEALVKEGAAGARLAGRVREEAREAARTLPHGAGRLRGRDRSTSSCRCSRRATPSSTAATPTTTTTSPARSGSRPKGLHYVDMGTSGGVWGLERGYCLMIGGEKEVVKRLDPIFTTLAPGPGDIPRTPGREKMGGTAEHGYLHCGPAGAGHFVKMIHNGIEYGLMAAYAEGLNILKQRQHRQGATPREGRGDDAAAEPRALPVRLQPRRHHRAVAARQRRHLLAPRPHGPGPGSRPRTSTKFGGKVSDSGEGRWTVAAANDDGRARPRADRVALRALRLARAGPLPEQGAVRHALRLRRPRREEDEGGAGRRSDALVFFGATGDLAYKKIFPALQRLARRGKLDCPGGRRGQVGLDPRAARGAGAGQRHRARRRLDDEAFAQLAAPPPLRGRRLQRPRHVRPAHERSSGGAQRPAHYLAIPPSMFPVVVKNLAGRGLREPAPG